MLKNFFSIALRNILKHKVYSAINVLSLAIGMTAFILLLLFLRENLGFNRHFAHSDRIYRLLRRTQNPQGDVSYTPSISGPAGPALQRDYPEVEAVTELLVRGMRLEHGKNIYSCAACIGDSNTTRVFSLPLVDGDARTRLQTPFSALITERTAEAMFGDKKPIGEVITLKYKWFDQDYTITGVLKNTPRQTIEGLRFDFLTTTIPPTQATSIWNDWKPNSSFRPLFAYILLREGTDPRQLERKLPDFITRYMGAETARTNSYHLQPITRIQLYARHDYNYAYPGYGDINIVYEFTVIAGFILLIACVNFMNLSTARSADRAREVGLRKVLGAHRPQIMGQFICESIVLALLALLLGLFFSEQVLPAINLILQSHLELDIWQNPTMLFGLVGLAALVGAFAGIYPAFFLSAFQPVDTLKGVLIRGGGRAWLRKGLVVSQFTISIVLVISAFVVNRQALFLLSYEDRGFRQKDVVMLNIFDLAPELDNQIETVKHAFAGNPNVLSVSRCERPPGMGDPDYFGLFRPEGSADVVKMDFVGIDEDYINTFDLKLVKGRNLSKDIPADANNYLINEAAAKLLGWDHPIGKRLDWPAFPLRNGVVVGVVKNFKDLPLTHHIGPMVLWNNKGGGSGNLAVHLASGSQQEAIAFLQAQWQKFVKERPFSFSSVEGRLRAPYFDTLNMGFLYDISTLLAIFVTCLGLFGLASFLIQQRTREIGIRKIFGASILQIMVTISQDFVRIVLIANLVAWPVAYWLMEHWLQTYAYRISMGILMFLLSSLLSFIIAFASIGIQALRAARISPIDALRYE